MSGIVMWRAADVSSRGEAGGAIGRCMVNVET